MINSVPISASPFAWLDEEIDLSTFSDRRHASCFKALMYGILTDLPVTVLAEATENWTGKASDGNFNYFKSWFSQRRR
ncbi:MAG: hypothetical protein G5701_02960 [Serratia symbiotica]|nr:hypothetical protein [Serratia symbiotica]